MGSERFLDLYISETSEHHRLLVRSLLQLESGHTQSIEDAFRAAHTIKGLAAAMGHSAAAAAAHSLEDKLSAIRSGDVEVDAAFADQLLQLADGVESAIADALRGTSSTGAAEAAAAAQSKAPTRSSAKKRNARAAATKRLTARKTTPRKSAVGRAATRKAGARKTRAKSADSTAAKTAARPRILDAPKGTITVMRIRLAPDTPLPEARAMIIRKAAAAAGPVLGGDAPDKTGEFRLFLGRSADNSAMEAAALRAGDVQSVRFESVASEPAKPAASEPEPLPSSVRVDRARLDELAEAVAELSVLHARGGETPDAILSNRSGSVLSTLQRVVLELRMVPASLAFERLARVVRDAARSLGKEVAFQMTGGEIELDQSVLDALVDPLVHLLRNAVDHAMELPAEREAAGKPRKGSVRLEILRERSNVRIVVSDDGRGIRREAVAARARELELLSDTADPSDDEIFHLLFQPGFSTAQNVTELSGRGVGLDVVAERVRSLGGAIEVSTTEGAGATFTLRVPVTLALAHALRIRVGGEEYAMPLTNVSEVVPLDGDVVTGGRRGAIRVRDDLVPLIDLSAVLGAPRGHSVAAVVAELAGRRVAIAVDQVIGHEQIVVKSFDAPRGTLPVFSGATLLPDGRPALLIDPLSVL